MKLFNSPVGRIFINIYFSKMFCTICPIFTFSPKFCKLLRKLIMFSDKILGWWLLIEIVIKRASFYFFCCLCRGIESMGITPQLYAKVTTFDILLTFCYGISRKKLWLLKFSNIFVMKSHTMIVKTLSEEQDKPSQNTWLLVLF